MYAVVVTKDGRSVELRGSLPSGERCLLEARVDNFFLITIIIIPLYHTIPANISDHICWNFRF